MSDRISIDTDTYELLCTRLSHLGEELKEAQHSLRSVDLSGCSIRTSQLPLASLSLQDQTFSADTLEELLRVYPRALSWVAENTHRLSQQVSQARHLFETTERSLIDFVNGDVEDSDDTVYLSFDMPMALARTVPGTTLSVMSEKDAKSFLDSIFGINAVKKTGMLFWTDYVPHESLQGIFNVLTGNTDGMTAEEIRTAKTDFVFNAYAILMIRAGGSLSADEYNLHYEAMVKYGESLSASDPSCGLFSKYKSQIPGVDEWDSGGADGYAIAKFALNSPHLIAIAADTVSRNDATFILSELSTYKPAAYNPSGREAITEMVSKGKASIGQLPGEYRSKSNSSLKEIANMIHSIESSI